MLRYTWFRPEERTSSRGSTFTVWKEGPQMPRIDDRYLDCSAYLYPTQPNAERGERIGGTAFMVAVPAADDGWLVEGKCPIEDYHHCYIASNRHVAEKHPVVRLNTHDGRFNVLPFRIDDWTFSEEHDLAVVQVEYRGEYRSLYINTGQFLTKALAARFDVGIGDEVFMVGRFISHDGKQKNSPSIRWGHVAMMPGEPIYHASNPSGFQEGFLVEIHSISGYSGSPVFVRPFPSQKVEVARGATTVSTTQLLYTPDWLPHGGPYLLGVEWGYINTHDQRANNTGVSGVVPAWFLLDLLNSPKLKSARAEQQRSLVEHVWRGGTTLT